MENTRVKVSTVLQHGLFLDENLTRKRPKAIINMSCCSENDDESLEVEREKNNRSPSSEISSCASLSSIVSFPEYELRSHLSTDDVKKELQRLTKRKAKSFVQACRNFDRRGSDKILRSHLKQVIYIFCFPITMKQFDALCRSMHIDDSVKINYMEFFRSLGGGDDIDVQHPADKIWDLYDLNSTGTIPYKEFLIKLGNNVARYKKYTAGSKIRNKDSIQCDILENNPSALALHLDDTLLKTEVNEDGDSIDCKITGLSGKRLHRKLKHHLNANLKSIEKAFAACDKTQSGFIPIDRFRSVLSAFCLHLSVDQLKELQLPDDKIEYRNFLAAFKKEPEEDTKKWMAVVEKLSDFKSNDPLELSIDDAKQMLDECVRARHSAISNDLQELDPCGVGAVGKADVRRIFDKFVCRFNDRQFKELWGELPVNKYDQLLYEDFLKKFSALEATPEPIQEQEEQTEGFSKLSLCNHKQLPKKVNTSKSSEGIFSDQLRKVFDVMAPSIVRNLRKLSSELRRADSHRSGHIHMTEFVAALERVGVRMTKEEEFQLMEKLDPGLTEKVDYRQFLKIFAWYA